MERRYPKADTCRGRGPALSIVFEPSLPNMLTGDAQDASGETEEAMLRSVWGATRLLDMTWL